MLCFTLLYSAFLCFTPLFTALLCSTLLCFTLLYTAYLGLQRLWVGHWQNPLLVQLFFLFISRDDVPIEGLPHLLLLGDHLPRVLCPLLVAHHRLNARKRDLADVAVEGL